MNEFKVTSFLIEFILIVLSKRLQDDIPKFHVNNTFQRRVELRTHVRRVVNTKTLHIQDLEKYFASYLNLKSVCVCVSAECLLQNLK